MKKLTVLSFICLGVLASCGDAFEDDSLTFVKTPYVGNELRIDGYFYKKNIDGSCMSFLLYRNGVATNPLSFDSNANCEEEYASGEYINFIKSNKNEWGLFKINHDSLNTEFFSGFGGLHRYSYTNIYKIVNDTTVYLYKSFLTYDGSKIDFSKDTFHFKEFSPKPDSINQWIP